jgi:hypothetical protein
MGLETVWQFREIEILIDTDAPGTLTIRTELPDYDLTTKHQLQIDTTTTTDRRTVRIRLPGDVKGSLMYPRFEMVSGVARIYGARVLAKPLGGPGAWRWLDLPVRQTPEALTDAPLPIRETPEGFADANLPIRSTPEDFTDAALPIRATPEGWERLGLPLIGTPLLAEWVDVPVDAVE